MQINTDLPDRLSDEMIWLWNNVEKSWHRIHSFAAHAWMVTKPNWYLGWVRADCIAMPTIDPIYDDLDPHVLCSAIRITQTPHP